MGAFRKTEKKDPYQKSTPENPRHSDTFLVEFPKSGITWLSTILANVALIESGREEIAGFVNSRLFVPDIHVSRTLADPIHTRPPVRLIKSHAAFNPNYGFVIYLCREPLPVMKSFYQYEVDLGHFSGNFDEFCRSEKTGIAAWKRHVNSWLTGPVLESRRLCLVRYEDLLRDPQKEVSAINEIFGWSLSRTAIDAAIERSTMEVMKRDELTYKSRNPRYTMTFVGGKKQFEVTPETEEFIRSASTEECRLLGYPV